MISEKQLAANQANAQKNTGPKTPEGKAKSRMNAKRDGITGQVTTLSDEDRPVFEELKARLIADLTPKTEVELKLASDFAWDTWRLDRVRAVEMNIFAVGSSDPANDIECDDPQIRQSLIDAQTFCQQSAKLALLSLYEQRLNRSRAKNLAALDARQATRKQAEKAIRDEEILLARASQIKQIPYKASAASVTGGFVFSNDEIVGTANREVALTAAHWVVNKTPSEKEFAIAAQNASNNILWPVKEAA